MTSAQTSLLRTQRRSVLRAQRHRLWYVLAAATAINLAFWLAGADVQARWANVPPVPSRQGALTMGMGDSEFAYRSGAITLQNLGDDGSSITPLKDYDYVALGRWFDLLDNLDPASDHVPMVAAYYFGATRVPSDARIVAQYLGRIGTVPVGEKWRWLAQGAYMARHRVHDLDFALDLAYKLARMPDTNPQKPLPIWARQMPAQILKDKNEKEDAIYLMKQVLMTDPDLVPADINFMTGYLHEQLGVSQADIDQLLRMRGVAADLKAP